VALVGEGEVEYIKANQAVGAVAEAAKGGAAAVDVELGVTRR